MSKTAAPEVTASDPPALPARLRVEQPWHAPPLVKVPWERVQEVQKALAEAGFRNRVGEEGEFYGITPEATVILRWEADQENAQRVLDALDD